MSNRCKHGVLLTIRCGICKPNPAASTGYAEQHIIELERKLKEARRTIERLVSEASETPELLKELAEAREESHRRCADAVYWENLHKKETEYQATRANLAESQLSALKQENERLDKGWQDANESLLDDRFKQGVEVEGELIDYSETNAVFYLTDAMCLKDFYGKSVTVTVRVKEEV